MKPNNFKVDQDKKIMLDTVKKKYTNYLIKIFCGSIILIAYYCVFFRQYGPDMNGSRRWEKVISVRSL